MKKIEEIRSYCLNCKNSQCRIKGCPLGNCIPEFIHEVDSKKAYEILCNTTVLPAICGRICPHEKQCEGSCIRGIKGEPVSIGAMEAYIGDLSIENNYELSIEMDERAKDKRVAVIGSGPAGLTCAAFLARKGVKVTIYEKHDKLGGLLTHGIPEFRLPREVVEKTIEKILDLGVEAKLNQELERDFEIEDLAKKYDAVFVAIGANIPAKMNVEGEGLEGVYGGNYLLEYNKHPNYTGKKVAIIGGGNVAMDSARTIKKLGASEVYVIYRRAEEQMPAEKKEIADAKKEGIEFLFQTNIVKILGKEKVEKLECICQCPPRLHAGGPARPARHRTGAGLAGGRSGGASARASGRTAGPARGLSAPCAGGQCRGRGPDPAHRRSGSLCRQRPCPAARALAGTGRKIAACGHPGDREGTRCGPAGRAAGRP